MRKTLLLLYILLLGGSLHAAPPCAIVIFGATGDLTARKLLPAVYHLAQDSQLPPNFAVVGFARGDNTDTTFRRKMGDALDQFSRTKPKDPAFWEGFQAKVFYHRAEYDKGAGYESLKKMLLQLDEQLGTQGNRIYYLATPSSQFAPIIKQLHDHQLLYSPSDARWSRVIIEKPFGSDLDSAVKLQEDISKYLDASQVYLMDHYLGKEGVQALLALRFKNGFFEPLWNHEYIDHVEITLGEEIGIGTRAQFWEETGLLRDVFQNHVLQLLALAAMEPPAVLDAPHMHEEKIRVVKAIRPIADPGKEVIRGQYGPGAIKGNKVEGYKQEKGVPAHSTAETFVAAKLCIDNARWKGVPFYIRAGKRLSKQTTEIAVVFKNSANALFIRIQPNANIFLKALALAPLKPAGDPFPEAYEKLLLDCIQGDHSLYVEAEEQFAAWRLLTPVLKYWQSHPENIQLYEAGSWGPASAYQLVKWQLIEN